MLSIDGAAKMVCRQNGVVVKLQAEIRTYIRIRQIHAFTALFTK